MVILANERGSGRPGEGGQVVFVLGRATCATV